MAVLDVARAVGLKTGMAVPSQIFGSTDRDAMEMQSLLNEAADDIAQVHEWQRFKTIAILTGDGSSTGFDLPDDYDRMLTKGRVWTSRYNWAMAHVVNSDDWLEMLVRPYTQVNGSWTIYDGQMHVLDAMALNDTARFFYLSNLVVAPQSGDKKSKFTSDTDTFRLSEKLLGLCAIAKRKAQKGQDYSEDLALYNIELASQIQKDGGSKPVLGDSSGQAFNGVPRAWPGTISEAP